MEEKRHRLQLAACCTSGAARKRSFQHRNPNQLFVLLESSRSIALRQRCRRRGIRLGEC